MANSDSYVEHTRKQRESPNVLRLRVLQILSGRPNAVIFVFEGVEDIGPYEVWFRTLSQDLKYVPLPAQGKTQVLAFAQQILQTNKYQNSIYFFIDRDFDGLRHVKSHKQIFCTSAYSVENYLCTKEVLDSILIDEFRLAGRQAVIDKVHELFSIVTADFCLTMRDANVRLFCGTVCSLRNGKVENRIHKYLKIEYASIEKNPTANLTTLVPLKRDPSAEELGEAEHYFDQAESFLAASRGKFLLNFFLVWLEELKKAFSKKQLVPPDGLNIQIKLSRNELTLRNLATRTTPPAELQEFVRHAFTWEK